MFHVEHRVPWVQDVRDQALRDFPAELAAGAMVCAFGLLAFWAWLP